MVKRGKSRETKARTRWGKYRLEGGVGSRNRERGDQRREKFRRVCVRVRVRVGKTGRETKGAPKFPSSLEEGLSARSLYDPRVVAGARLRGRCFRVTRTTPKKCVCACVAAWFNCRPRCRLAFSSRDHERGILRTWNIFERKGRAEERKEERKKREGKRQRKERNRNIFTKRNHYRSRHHRDRR